MVCLRDSVLCLVETPLAIWYFLCECGHFLLQQGVHSTAACSSLSVHSDSGPCVIAALLYSASEDCFCSWVFSSQLQMGVFGALVYHRGTEDSSVGGTSCTGYTGCRSLSEGFHFSYVHANINAHNKCLGIVIVQWFCTCRYVFYFNLYSCAWRILVKLEFMPCLNC